MRFIGVFVFGAIFVCQCVAGSEKTRDKRYSIDPNSDDGLEELFAKASERAKLMKDDPHVFERERLEKSIRDMPELHYHLARVAREAKARAKRMADDPQVFERERQEKSIRDMPELHYHLARVAREAQAVGSKDIEIDQKDGKVLQTLPRSAVHRFRRDQNEDSREDDVEDKATETKAQIAKIASEVEGMKSESASAKEGVKQLETQIEAEGAEVKRKAAVALANKEAELKAEKEKETEKETEIEEGQAREEALHGDVNAKNAEIAALKEQAAAALAAAAHKDADDVAAERNKTRVLLMELTALLSKQKQKADTEIEEDETIITEERNRATTLVASLKAQLEALELKLQQQEASNAELTGALAKEVSAKKEDQAMAEQALAQEAEMRIHDAQVMGKMMGVAEERLAEKLAKAEMQATLLQRLMTTMAPTVAAATNGTTGANQTAAATAKATTAAAANATAAPSRKPIKVKLDFEIDPAELEAGQQ